MGVPALMQKEFKGHFPGPNLLVTGGVHGDEFTPMAAVRRLMTRVDEANLHGSVTLVPIVNDAAWRRGERTAEDGLDLARVCPGDREGSITQQAAHAVSQLIQRADYYIDLHTGSRTFSLLPFAGYTLHPDANVLEQQRAMARAFNLPIIWGTSPHLEGRTLSVARDAGVPAIYAEYLGSGACDEAGVEDYVAGCLNVMRELGMISRPRPADRVVTVIEDPTAGSGHMQVQNPSPTDGFFTPKVRLGENVERGAQIGIVCDSLGDETRAIHADRSGIALGLRTFSRVSQGEMTVVILEQSD